MYRGKPWTIRQFTGYNTPEDTNKRFKYEYEAGQTGFSIAFDFMLANAIAYIEEELRRDRLGIDDFAPVLTFHMSSHNDFFEELAKFRAARRMWYKLMTQRYGAKKPESATFKVHIQTAGSTLIYHQPLNNAIRVAYQVLAAALGGVQSMHATSYDEPICLPTEQSVLLSIRTQQIAQHESNVCNVADPLGGSYYVEWLTNELEEKAWEYL